MIHFFCRQCRLEGRSAVSDGVDAPSERRHDAPKKTPDELRVKTRRRASTEQVTIIGIDISKKCFQLHGATGEGKPVFRRTLSRGRLLAFLSEVPSCLVVMEACGGAKLRHSWSLVDFGEGRGMYGVELYAAVRLAVVEEGLSHREAGRRFGIDRRTVKKMRMRLN